MVGTSILPGLPGSGISELSARPSKSSPGPPPVTQPSPKLGSKQQPDQHCHDGSCNLFGFLAQGMAQARLGSGKLFDLHELERRRRGQSAAFGRVAIEKLEAFEAAGIELIMNILGQVGAHLSRGE